MRGDFLKKVPPLLFVRSESFVMQYRLYYTGKFSMYTE